MASLVAMVRAAFDYFGSALQLRHSPPMTGTRAAYHVGLRELPQRPSLPPPQVLPPLSTPPPTRTTPRQTPLSLEVLMPLCPIPETKPCHFTRGSPLSSSLSSSHDMYVPEDVGPFLGQTQREARTRREELEARSRESQRMVFRAGGFAGKGTHRRGPVEPRQGSPRQAPKRTVCQEFRLRTEERGATAQAEVLRQRAERDAYERQRTFLHRPRAAPVPKTTYRRPPGVPSPTSPVRRAALQKKAARAA